MSGAGAYRARKSGERETAGIEQKYGGAGAERERSGKRGLQVAGPAAWNSLPVHIGTIQSHSGFCRHLKTHLFA